MILESGQPLENILGFGPVQPVGSSTMDTAARIPAMQAAGIPIKGDKTSMSFNVAGSGAEISQPKPESAPAPRQAPRPDSITSLVLKV